MDGVDGLINGRLMDGWVGGRVGGCVGERMDKGTDR